MSNLMLNELLAHASCMKQLREHIMQVIVDKPITTSERYAKEIFEKYKKYKKEDWVFCLSEGCMIDGIHCQPRLFCNKNGMYIVIFADKVWTYRKNEHDDAVSPISQAVFTKTYVKKSRYLLRDIVTLLDEYDKDISVMKLNKLHGVFHTPCYTDTLQLPPVLPNYPQKRKVCLNADIEPSECCVCLESTKTQTPCCHHLCVGCWGLLKEKDVDIVPCPLCRTDIRQKHLMLAFCPDYYDSDDDHDDDDDEYDENMAMRELIRAAEDNM
jgi:hypothetical protein